MDDPTLDYASGLSADNTATLDRLVRAIDLAEGFTLYIARCNIPVLRRQLIDRAAQRLAALGIRIVEVAFDEEVSNLRERLRRELRLQGVSTVDSVLPMPTLEPELIAVREPLTGYSVVPKRTLFVTGLEHSIPSGQPNPRLLAELNLGRDLFRRDTQVPLVLWLPDYAVTAVARFAPDFWAWRSGVFEFVAAAAQRSATMNQFVKAGPDWTALRNLTTKARLAHRRQLESLLDDYHDLAEDDRVARERLAILLDLGYVCAASQEFSEALGYLQQALDIARRVGDLIEEGNILDGVGNVYSALGAKAKALEFYQQALSIRRLVDDKAGEAVTLSNLGLVHDALGDRAKALEFLKQTLLLQRHLDDKAGEGITLNNIGTVYNALGNQAMALDFYQQALSLRRQVGDKAGEAVTLSNLGLVYNALGDKGKALEFYQQAWPLEREVGDRAGEATVLNNIGGVYSSLGDKAKALDFFHRALRLVGQVGDRWGESTIRYNMAMLYEAADELDRAEEELAQVVALDEASGRPDLSSDRAALERVREKRRMINDKRMSDE